MKRVLCTKPEAGTTAWGLVEKGKEQARNVSSLTIDCVSHQLYYIYIQAAEKMREMIVSVDGDSSKEIVVVSSDFTRTRETAEIVHSVLDAKVPLRLDPGLRERNLGDLDLKIMNPDIKPSIFDVWEDDETDESCSQYNAECVLSVAKRMSAVVESLNQEFEGKILVLVSHQDPLHILNALFTGIPLAMHRKQQIPPIGNCDIRELKTE